MAEGRRSTVNGLTAIRAAAPERCEHREQPGPWVVSDRRPDSVPRPPREDGGGRAGDGGWQKPVAPPTDKSRPSGPPPQNKPSE